MHPHSHPHRRRPHHRRWGRTGPRKQKKCWVLYKKDRVLTMLGVKIDLTTWIPNRTQLVVKLLKREWVGRVVDCRIYKGGEGQGVAVGHVRYIIFLEAGTKYLQLSTTMESATGKHISGDMFLWD